MVTAAIDNVIREDGELVDTPIKRAAVAEMQLASLEAMIVQLHEDRLKLATYTQQARMKNSTLVVERLHDKCRVALNRLENKVVRIRGLLEAAATDSTKIRMMLLEMGELIPGFALSENMAKIDTVIEHAKAEEGSDEQEVSDSE